MFRTILGCIHYVGHIDADAGLFGVLDEKIVHLERDSPIPARANTGCKCRLSGDCSVECPKAITGFMACGIISWQQEGVRA